MMKYFYNTTKSYSRYIKTLLNSLSSSLFTNFVNKKREKINAVLIETKMTIERIFVHNFFPYFNTPKRIINYVSLMILLYTTLTFFHDRPYFSFYDSAKHFKVQIEAEL